MGKTYKVHGVEMELMRNTGTYAQATIQFKVFSFPATVG